ncbi:MAG: glycosyltransferase family 4 protein [Chloroflexaceae bacterium]|nr:glycosyltransferase family 4 protein [Chloroflexaceae bacterium]
MRILYLASGIPVPGSLGGSTHAHQVARGLALRGHTVHLVATSQQPRLHLAPLVRPVSQRLDGFHLHHLDLPRAVSLLTVWPVVRLLQAIQPDVVMERYYNFAGAGIWAAHRAAVPSLLEVNALIVDPPVIFKRRLDDALGQPMRRWAVQQCHWASHLITPLQSTIPPDVPRSKITELPWGADVTAFARPEPIEHTTQNTDNPPIVIFAGSFRAWHGARDLVHAALLLLHQGYSCRFVFLGDGPERDQAQRLAAPRADAFHFTGMLPYTEVPAWLHRASIGVAPFRTAAHPALGAAGFFWSPLKVFEYMAASLPVVTADLPPLNTIIRDGQEGTLFHEGDHRNLATAIARLLENPVAAMQMGQQARERVVAHYSWQRHCAELEQILLRISA